MDPYLVLGILPGSSEHEIAAAYRRLAKRWHPDRGDGDERARRMAEINVAYDVLRAAAYQESGAPGPGPPPAAARGREGRWARRGAWLTEPMRRALGPELLEALRDGEEVRLVTPTSTWASPRALLALTERRLLWLLDDAPIARVRSLALAEVADVGHRVRRPRGKAATLTVRTHGGRRLAFAGLRPHTAATIERHLRAARRPSDRAG